MRGRRVVITGLGAITPLGQDKNQLWSALIEGKSGIKKITLFDASSCEVHIAGEVQDFDPTRWFDQKQARRLDRFVQFAVAASTVAVEDAGLDFNKTDRDKVGVIIGSGIGGIHEIEEQHSILLQKGPSRVSPFMIPRLMVNAAPGQVAIKYQIYGPNFSIVSACASGAHAIGEAFRIVQMGEADVMITGGSEATITPLCVGGFSSMKALSTRNNDPERASRPFDKERDGFVISEGAGIVVLEELNHAKQRNAKIYAELIGYGKSADASHIAAPDPEGRGACVSMRNALNDAQRSPEDISYINAHATSTPLGDEVEIKAIKTVFNQHANKLVISSTKSMLGHQLGAAGSVELLICALALQHNVVPPTINYETPDPKCNGLDFVPNEAREMKLETAMSNSFGFGGHNVSLIIGRCT
ncbi:MAG TPA: beta-ketoacyl-ACP synthase II [Candidatus Brocadiales bacterium]|nr:beta-ketoacyl-ACP synthase II [Candidatus Brocadiales bacterium]